MKTHRIVVLISCVLLPLIAVVNQFAFADLLEQETKKTVVSDAPVEAAYPHYIRLRIIKVTPVEKTDKLQILKLDVERHYGKISADSRERALKNDTQRLSILFPAALGADVREGDLVDYRMTAFHKLDRE